MFNKQCCIIYYDVALVFLAFFAFGGSSNSGYTSLNSDIKSVVFLEVFFTESKKLTQSYNSI